MRDGNPDEGPDPDAKHLVRLSVALAHGDPGAVREVMERCALEASPVQVEEAILQSYLFLGYPAALNAFGLWREISGRGAGEGVADDWASWSERGEDVCRTVYGGQYDGLRKNVRALHPDMERWMVVEGYGKVLGRPGLSLRTRELCIAALLAVLDTPRQLYSHLRGALNAGATPGEVTEALREAEEKVDGTGRDRMWSVWRQVRERSAHAPTGSGPQGPKEGDADHVR